MSQPTVGLKKSPKWSTQLTETHLVNWAAISDDGGRVIADTYYYPYPGTTNTDTHGAFGTFCYDSAGNKLWSDEYEGDEGVFSVTISGDGQVAAAGGLLSGGAYSDRPDSGLLRAYDANDGTRLLDYRNVRRRINSMDLSDDGTVLAAVSANKLYVFVRKNGSFPVDPVIPVGGGQFLDCVAVHPSGEWLVTCDRAGNVYLVTIAEGAVQETHTWTAPVAIPFLSVAISKTSDSFVVGGGNALYVFTQTSISAGNGPIAQFTPGNVPPSGAQQNVRWVAISGDGEFITSVENQQAAGLLRAFSYRNNQLNPVWQQPLNHNPNSTSVDSAAQYVTVCDGNPINTPGTFYLFDGRNGNKLWDFVTTNMNWPMFISADASGIAGGSDNGKLYYFVP